MKKRAVCIIFISVFLVLTFLPVVFAAGNNVFTPLDDLFTQIIPNQDIRLPNVRDNVTLYIFATFTIVYAIIFASTGLIPLFQNERGARIAVAVALAIMSVLFPGAIRLISTLGPPLIMILAVVAVFMIVWTGVRGFTGGAGVLPAEWQRERMDLGRERQDYSRERQDARREMQNEKNERRALRGLRGEDRAFRMDIDHMLRDMRDMLRRVTRIRELRNRAPESPEVQGEMHGILQDFANIVPNDYRVVNHHTPRMNQFIHNLENEFIIDAAIDAAAANLEHDIAHHLHGQMPGLMHHPGGGAPILATPAQVQGNARLQAIVQQIAQDIQRKQAALLEIRNREHQLQVHIGEVNRLLGEIRNAFQNGRIDGVTALINACIQELTGEENILGQIQTYVDEEVRLCGVAHTYVNNQIAVLNAEIGAGTFHI